MMKNNITFKLMGAMMLLSSIVDAQNLFISEVADPADEYTGRFVELYNAGAESIDFGTVTYYLAKQTNGGTTWSDVLLSGSIEAGETYVIGGSGFEAVHGFAPDQISGVVAGNGDDAYYLYQDADHETGTLVDIYGVKDVDGSGEAWEYTDAHAIRDTAVNMPSISWLDSEWLIEAADIADCSPGSHNGSQGPPVAGAHQLSINNDTIGFGAAVIVPVLVTELTAADNIISYQFTLSFDTLALEYQDASIAGTLSDGGSLEVNAAVAGELSLAYMNTVALIGEGALLNLNFTSLQPDTSMLTLTSAYLNNDSTLNLSDGSILVKSLEPPTAALSYSDTLSRFTDSLLITAVFSAPMDPIDPVLLDMSGAAILTDVPMTRIADTLYTYILSIPKTGGEVYISFSRGSDIWGNTVLSTPSSGGSFTILPFRPGDVDDDGLILAYDAALVLQYSVGLDPLSEDPSPWEAWRDSTANVDGTGVITANDAAMILRYSANVINSFEPTSKKGLSDARVSFEIMDDKILVYSHGDLVGLNLSCTNSDQMLQAPILLSSRFMEAHLVEEGVFNVGLCTAEAVPDATPILSIPFEGERRLKIKLSINSRYQEVVLDLTTRISQTLTEGLSIYPNPVLDMLHISIGKSEERNRRIVFVNQLGQTILERELIQGKLSINKAEMGTGCFIIKVFDDEGNMEHVKRVVVL